MVVGVLTGAVIALGSATVGLIGVATLGSMVLVVLVRRLTHWPEDPGAETCLMKWTIGAFALHLFLGLIIINNSAAVSYLGGDALTYHAQAIKMVAHWVHGAPMPKLPAGKDGFYYLLAGLYWVFGPTKLGGVALNAVLAAALVPVVADTTRRLSTAAAARSVPIVMVLVPGMVIWPSQLLKEAPVLLLLAVAANCAVRLSERFTLTAATILAAALSAVLTFRGQLGFGVVIAMVIGVVVSRQHVVSGAVAGFATIGLIAAMVTLGIGSSGYQTSLTTNLQQAQSYRAGSSSTANSGFAADANISSVPRALYYLPQGMVVMGLGPFPWQLHGLRELVAVPDVVAWWVLVAAFWRGQKSVRREASRRRLLVLILPTLVTMVILALVIGNFGTVARERMQMLVLVAPVMAMGIAEWRHDRQPVDIPAAALSS